MILGQKKVVIRIKRGLVVVPKYDDGWLVVVVVGGSGVVRYEIHAMT